MAVITELWKIRPIEYLVQAKYATYVALNGGSRSSSGNEFGAGFPEVEAYRDKLKKLPPEDIAKLVAEQRNADAEIVRKKREIEESLRSFNRQEASADFEYWAKAAYWTIDEAIALSFGRDPNRVSWKNISPLTSVSGFAGEFAARRVLARRAVSMGQLAESNIPGFFVAWAERMKVEIAPGLKEALTDLGIQIADWKTLFEHEKTRAEEYRKLAAQLSVEKDMTESAVKAGLAKPTDRSKSASALERNSLLKLVIGMAVKGYAYDPIAPRSKTASEIAGDLRLLGLAIDDDTIRKYLKEGAELLP